MSLTRDLLRHASRILQPPHPDVVDDAAMRRAISACYYSLFNQIKADTVRVIAPHVALEINHRIQRWFDHAEMKKVCGRFLAAKLDQPLLGLIGPDAPAELQLICRTFIQLQDARHSADYDLGYSFTFSECMQLMRDTYLSIATWDDIKDTAEANVFMLSLLMWKNWEDKERRP